MINALSYNINFGDTTTVDDKNNGILIKQALQTCSTLNDFEQLLNKKSKPFRLKANFGVIDAGGGAAYYEIGNAGYTKFDVNDRKIAPFGYIIRTNFSFTGAIDKGSGYIRYQTAENLFYKASAMKTLTPRFILRDVVRCLKHSLTEKDLWQLQPENGHVPVFIPFEDYLPRFLTASATIIQGVRKDESPALTTMWTIPGFTLCAVAVPSWAAGNGCIPSLAMSESPGGNSPFCSIVAELKKRCFPIERGSGIKYLNLSAVINKEGDGILQALEPLENEIFAMTDLQLEKWRSKSFSEKDATDLVTVQLKMEL